MDRENLRGVLSILYGITCDPCNDNESEVGPEYTKMPPFCSKKDEHKIECVSNTW